MEAHFLMKGFDHDDRSYHSSTTTSRSSAAFNNESSNSDSIWSSRTCPAKCRNHRVREKSYLMNWDLLGFLKNQDVEDYRQISLGSIITLTGAGSRSEATTAAEYLERNWPSTGLSLLEALQSAVQDRQGQSQFSHPDIVISIGLAEPACVHVWLAGCSEIIREVEEQLKWIGCSFRLPSYHQIECSSAVVSDRHLLENTVTVIEFVTKPMPVEDAMMCWVPLFSSAVIACGPTAPRSDEMGLEMSFDMMVALAGIHHAVTFEGGLLLKGFSTILVPTHIYPESIQWHFLSVEDERLLSYGEVRKSCSTRVLGNKISFESMRRKRAFVGWCKTAETCLGTQGVEYAKIGYSDTREAGRGMRLIETQIVFQYNIGINLNLRFGPKYNRFYPRKGAIQEIIEHAQRTPVILCDVRERRSWLVWASDVILHMIHTKHAQVQSEGKRLNLIYPGPGQNGLSATHNSLKVNADADYHFRDLVQKYWSFLDDCQATNVKKDIADGIPIRNNVRTTIEGWDYMALVKDDSPRYHKSAIIKGTGGGWTRLAKDIKAIVLLATGLGDIIRPVSTDSVCRKLMTLPVGNDYLATTVSILVELFNRAGSSNTQSRITNKGLRWHRPSKLFEACSSIGRDDCDCDRLQQLIPRRNRFREIFQRTIFGSVVPPGKLEQQGAVMFGQTRLRMIFLSAASRFFEPILKRRGCQLKEELREQFENRTIDQENKNLPRKIRSRDDEGEDSDSKNSLTPARTKRRRTSRACMVDISDQLSWTNSSDSSLAPTNTDLPLPELLQTLGQGRRSLEEYDIPSSDTLVPAEGAD